MSIDPKRNDPIWGKRPQDTASGVRKANSSQASNPTNISPNDAEESKIHILLKRQGLDDDNAEVFALIEKISKGKTLNPKHENYFFNELLPEALSKILSSKESINHLISGMQNPDTRKDFVKIILDQVYLIFEYKVPEDFSDRISDIFPHINDEHDYLRNLFGEYLVKLATDPDYVLDWGENFTLENLITAINKYLLRENLAGSNSSYYACILNHRDPAIKIQKSAQTLIKKIAENYSPQENEARPTNESDRVKAFLTERQKESNDNLENERYVFLINLINKFRADPDGPKENLADFEINTHINLKTMIPVQKALRNQKPSLIELYELESFIFAMQILNHEDEGKSFKINYEEGLNLKALKAELERLSKEILIDQSQSLRDFLDRKMLKRFENFPKFILGIQKKKLRDKKQEETLSKEIELALKERALYKRAKAERIDIKKLEGSFRKTNHFKGENLCEEDFRYKDLRRANFSLANLQGVNFYEAKLSNASFFCADLDGAHLNGADIQYSDLRGTELENLITSSSDSSDFYNENRIQSLISIMDEEEREKFLRIIGGKLAKQAQSINRKVILVESNLNNTDLRFCKLRKLDFSRVGSMQGAKLNYASLLLSKLSGIDMRYSRFTGADLRGADLNGSNLSNSNLAGADFRSTDLRGVDLSNADLRYALLDGAIIDRTTKFAKTSIAISDLKELCTQNNLSLEITNKDLFPVFNEARKGLIQNPDIEREIRDDACYTYLTSQTKQ